MYPMKRIVITFGLAFSVPIGLYDFFFDARCFAVFTLTPSSKRIIASAQFG